MLPMPATLVKRLTRHPWPILTLCPDCGDMVLKARSADNHAQGRPFVLDVVEVLPAAHCGWCVRGGHREPDCTACGGTGVHGERLTRTRHVLLDDYGHARRYDGQRRQWESAHRRHRCP